MKGLINKDLLMVKSNLKMLGMVFIAFILMALNDMSNFFFIPAFLSITIMMSTFSYDEYNKTNAFVITLPKGRENAVKAKYLATLLIVLISIILTFSIYFIVGFIKNNVDIEELFVSALGCGVGIILLEAILYPFIFKFGDRKSVV